MKCEKCNGAGLIPTGEFNTQGQFHVPCDCDAEVVIPTLMPVPGVMLAGGDPQLDRIEATLARIERMQTALATGVRFLTSETIIPTQVDAPPVIGEDLHVTLARAVKLAASDLIDLFQRTLDAVAPTHTYWIQANPELVAELRAAGFRVDDGNESDRPRSVRPFTDPQHDADPPDTLAVGDIVYRAGFRGDVISNSGTGFVVQWEPGPLPARKTMPTEYENGGYPWGFSLIEFGGVE